MSACGPNSNNLPIRLFCKLIPHNIFFSECCNIHDEMYESGGDEYNRKNADVLLFRLMIEKAINYFIKRNMISSIVWYIFLSYLYYLMIRVFGKKYFNYNKK